MSAVCRIASERDVHGAFAPVLRNFIGGSWVESRATETLDVYNPAKGEVIAHVPLSPASDVDAAAAAALAAVPEWRATPVAERARRMVAFRELLERHFEELA